jgi:hypothetical protein
MADLSLYRPVEHEELFIWAEDTDVIDPGDLTYIFQIAGVYPTPPTGSLQTYTIPYLNPGESPLAGGWDYFGGRVALGQTWRYRCEQVFAQQGALTLQMLGYRDHVIPTADDDVMDFTSPIDDVCVQKYARMLAFTTLEADRGLYQQWLAATNNTDASPTQLQGMLSQATGELDRQRKRSTLLRRTVIVGPQYTR